MRKILTLLLLLGLAAPARAQVSIPNTFTPFTVAQSSLVNANFAQLGALSLNRAGGNLTGNITADSGVLIDGVDVGTLATTGTPTLSKLTLTSSAADALKVTGGITAGSGNVAIIDTTGKIPALSSTYFASLSGANLTGLLEANITDGTILARLASNDTVTGAWIFTQAPAITFTNAALQIRNSSATADERSWFLRTNGSVFELTLCNDALNSCADPFTFTRTANALTNTSLTSTSFTLTGELRLPANQALTTVTGANNNIALTSGISTLTITTAGGGANNLTGIAGGADGRILFVCMTTTGSGTLAFLAEDGSSTAANRFWNAPADAITSGQCQQFRYNGGISRWAPVN